MSPAGAEALLVAFGLVFVAVTALGTTVLIGLLHPLLVRYALARPNARSAHREPTPQGGGIAVLAAAGGAALLGAAALGAEGPTALGFGPGSSFAIGEDDGRRLLLVMGAALLVAIVGLVDDVRPLPSLPRLSMQLIAMAVAVSALPESARVLPWLPVTAERALLVVGGAWFVNLTNFMDGMDWLTVAEMGPVTAALSLFWLLGFVSAPAGLAAASLLGGLAGFAPFNRPVARLFLGDVGSLPIGLLVAFGLFDLASRGGLPAAILLPLYYIADSGLTLAWRLRRGEPVWKAHRSHFYQVAVARGFSVPEILRRVLATNLALAGLAAVSLFEQRWTLALVEVGLGTLAVGLLLRTLARGKPAAIVGRRE